ncbi:Fibronectin type III domain protein [compost metagenome]
MVNPFNDKTIRFNYKEGSSSPNIRYNSVYEWEAAASQISGTVASPLKYPSGTIPSDVIKFYCNPTPTNQSFSLPTGSFIDVKNQAYCGTLTLTPYSSVILLKASSVNCVSPDSCGVPTNVVVTATSDTTATLSWNAAATAINYDVRYKGTGEADWKYYHNIFGTSALLINLDPEKTYQYQVRRSCYGTESDWVLLEDTTATTAASVKQIQVSDLKSKPAPVPKVNLTAYPNPFKNQTTVAFNLPLDQEKVTLNVYNIMGNRVQGLFEGKVKGQQSYIFEFDRKLLPAGVYFVRLITSQNTKHIKIVITD